MSTLLVSFDLVAPGRNYRPLYEYIGKLEHHNKPLQTVYLLQTNKSVTQVRDDLQVLVDANDKILVIQVNTSFWATYNLQSAAKWLKAR